jgi:GT2 family glycosyltransferase
MPLNKKDDRLPDTAGISAMTCGPPGKSFVIPVLDFSPHSEFNILTLLKDLADVEGEVICIFNSRKVYEKLRAHPRINKFCYNSATAGVSRSWNMGIELAEGRAVFILNADLRVGAGAVEQLESFLFNLDKAVVVGPQGAIIDYQNLRVLRYFEKGSFKAPVRTHDVSGFFFALNRQRYLENGLRFDSRFSPCFYEEWDMGLQVMHAGLHSYAVPVIDFDHHWGISQAEADTIINYFGRNLRRSDIRNANRDKFIDKWFQKLGYRQPPPA